MLSSLSESFLAAPTWRHIGIDEAGYGPILGPLVVTLVAVDGPTQDLAGRLATAGCGVADSKRIHRSGDLRPLEAIALPALEWLSGLRPTTAAECFALADENAEQRQLPWMAGADDLRLPVAAHDPASWSLADLQPICGTARIIHPAALNQASASGSNRAAVELAAIGELVTEVPLAPCTDLLVDRLGGRKFYRDSLATWWPDADCLEQDEAPVCSAYHLRHGDNRLRCRFHVGGESVSPLTAIASCIAKYLRELHMLLFNRYWCGRFRWLRPTAGYAVDGKRWLHQLGTGLVGAYATDLVRGDPAALLRI